MARRLLYAARPIVNLLRAVPAGSNRKMTDTLRRITRTTAGWAVLSTALLWARPAHAQG